MGKRMYVQPVHTHLHPCSLHQETYPHFQVYFVIIKALNSDYIFKFQDYWIIRRMPFGATLNELYFLMVFYSSFIFSFILTEESEGIEGKDWWVRVGNMLEVDGGKG